MHDTDIMDSDIPNADPAAVIRQYEPYLQRLANRYAPALALTGAVGVDDLLQAGRIATVTAQRNYDPERGSFMTCLSFYARKAMRQTLGFDAHTGAAPEALLYLDAPLSAAEDSDITLGDTIPDPAVPIDEAVAEAEAQRETAEQIHAALARMKYDRQREAVTRIHIDGQERAAAAEDMGINAANLRTLEQRGKDTLRRDYRLRKYAQTMPFVHVGVSRFNTTWTSSVEELVMWRLQHLQQAAKDVEEAAGI